MLRLLTLDIPGIFPPGYGLFSGQFLCLLDVENEL